jgi:hypothetical protein
MNAPTTMKMKFYRYGEELRELPSGEKDVRYVVRIREDSVFVAQFKTPDEAMAKMNELESVELAAEDHISRGEYWDGARGIMCAADGTPL